VNCAHLPEILTSSMAAGSLHAGILIFVANQRSASFSGCVQLTLMCALTLVARYSVMKANSSGLLRRL